MFDGLGRGPPGRSPRSPPPPPPGPGRGPGFGAEPGRALVPPPVTPNGLLPPGRGPGLGPGRGAERRSVVEPPPLGRSPSPLARRLRASSAALAAASCCFFSASALAWVAATSMSWALAGLVAGVGGPGTGRFFAGAFFSGFFTGGAGLPIGAFGLGPGLAVTPGFFTEAGAAASAGFSGFEPEDPAANSSRSRRATGASTVLDADLTNSPISLSLASTILLVTPNSLASSCTRALPATALLISRSCGHRARRPQLCT